MAGITVCSCGNSLHIPLLATTSTVSKLTSSQWTDFKLISQVLFSQKGELMRTQFSCWLRTKTDNATMNLAADNVGSQVTCSREWRRTRSKLNAGTEGCHASFSASSHEQKELNQVQSVPVVTRRLVVFGSTGLASATLPSLDRILPGVALAEEQVFSGLDSTAASAGEEAAAPGAPMGSTPRSESVDAAHALEADTGSVSPDADSGSAELAEAGLETDSIEGRPGQVGTDEPVVTRKVFFDVAIDGQPVGKIVVGLYGKDVPIGAARFAELAAGKQGVSYRKKEFVKIYPGYVQNAGLRSFSLTGGDRDSAQFTGGETADKLVREMQRVAGASKSLRNIVGAVSIVAVDPTIPPPKTKLIARDGGFVTVEEATRPPPNGTEFAIVTKDSPELDATNLVVGKVLEGWTTVEAISQVQAVKENTSSPYFMTAKMIGDSRAVVAERGFNRPYVKVVITKCGELL